MKENHFIIQQLESKAEPGSECTHGHLQYQTNPLIVSGKKVGSDSKTFI